MGDFAIWTPKFDGDAPPNWKAGMARSFRRLHSDAEWHLITGPSSDDLWWAKNEYAVPHEAIFDYPTWAAQGRANADKLPSGVAEALGPERDWADELHYLLQETKPSERCALIKSRCRPIGNDTVTDELVALLGRAHDFIGRGTVQSKQVERLYRDIQRALEVTQ